MERYLRHIILPNIGIRKQEKLKRSKVLVVGLGALGSVVSVYLAAIGIGYLKLVDFDVISISNLHRQVFYKPSDINKPKTETLKKYINDFNPEVKLEVINEALGYDNFEKIVEDIDIIVDATDRISKKFLLSYVSVLYNKPLVFGSIYQYEGMVGILYKRCLNCIFQESYDVPSCDQSGVFPPIAPLIASIQTNFTLKYLLNLSILKNVIFIFDLLNDTNYSYKVKVNKECICNNKEILQNKINQLKEIELGKIIQNNELEVIDISNLPMPSKNGNIDFLQNKIEKLIKDNKKVVLVCNRGEKSLEYVKYFLKKGLKCYSLKTGKNPYNQCN